MASREVLYLLDEEGAVLWSDVCTASELSDSRARWEAIWSRRQAVAAVAHSHPHGPLAFSGVDRTTMAALDAALGRSLSYLVVAPGGVVACRDGVTAIVEPEPPWAERIREESFMKRRMS
jgi:hypothetical protein